MTHVRNNRMIIRDIQGGSSCGLFQGTIIMTLWDSLLTQKLTVAQLIKKVPAFYVIHTIIIVFT
jgi:hypothetical protein